MCGPCDELIAAHGMANDPTKAAFKKQKMSHEKQVTEGIGLNLTAQELYGTYGAKSVREQDTTTDTISIIRLITRVRDALNHGHLQRNRHRLVLCSYQSQAETSALRPVFKLDVTSDRLVNLAEHFLHFLVAHQSSN